ncbi:hypothetical protein, partial [Myroides sp. N17-2]|uniref:hypothetical protein n=1 Tax=Myroides sp. N17-2 TaxID=2030799 RepID=UPI001C1FA857
LTIASYLITTKLKKHRGKIESLSFLFYLYVEKEDFFSALFMGKDYFIFYYFFDNDTSFRRICI